MNLKEGIDKIAALIEKFKTNEPSEPIVTTEQSFKEAKLIDGTTIIQYDAEELTQGIPVNVVTEQGIEPIPDGEYQLEDGSVLVTSGGLVAEYTKAAPMPEGETNAPSATQTTNVQSATPQTGSMEQKQAPKRVIKSQVEEHVFHLEIEGVEPIKVDFSSMFKSLIEENKALKELNKDMFNVIKEVAGEPATTPTEKVTKAFSIKDQRAAYRADLDRLHKEAQKLK